MHSNAHKRPELRTVNPSAYAYSGSNPPPATAGQAWYLAALAFDSDPSTRRSACKCD
jgi:hypothetical protein